MGADLEIFRAMVCIAKLESLRYDIVNHRQLIKQLENQIQFVLTDDKKVCRECLVTAYLYVKQIGDVAKLVEDSLRNFGHGRSMLMDLNNRMPA
jgi:hypothetical protein